MKSYNRKKMVVGALVGMAVAVSGVAFAANDRTEDFRHEVNFGKHQKHQVNPKVKEALEKEDFEMFKKFAKGKRAKMVTKETFSKMVQMHNARENGD